MIDQTQVMTTNYRSPIGHTFKDKEFDTCFAILANSIDKLRVEFEGGEEPGFEYHIYARVLRPESESELSNCDHSLFSFLLGKLAGWVIFDGTKPKYVSLPYFEKRYNEWKGQLQCVTS